VLEGLHVARELCYDMEVECDLGDWEAMENEIKEQNESDCLKGDGWKVEQLSSVESGEVKVLWKDGDCESPLNSVDQRSQADSDFVVTFRRGSYGIGKGINSPGLAKLVAWVEGFLCEGVLIPVLKAPGIKSSRSSNSWFRTAIHKSGCGAEKIDNYNPNPSNPSDLLRSQLEKFDRDEGQGMAALIMVVLVCLIGLPLGFKLGYIQKGWEAL